MQINKVKFTGKNSVFLTYSIHMHKKSFHDWVRDVLADVIAKRFNCQVFILNQCIHNINWVNWLQRAKWNLTVISFKSMLEQPEQKTTAHYSVKLSQQYCTWCFPLASKFQLWHYWLGCDQVIRSSVSAFPPPVWLVVKLQFHL